MQAKDLITALREHGVLEVYVDTPEGHKALEGVRLVRYNGNGPSVVEVLTDAALVPVAPLTLADD